MQELDVLLVDDEEEFVDTLAERLSMRGVNVRTALNGETALELLSQRSPDVVLLDVLMPGMGGLETLRAIKAGHPEVRVILLTGHASTRDGMEGMRQGALDYLMKPLKIEELMSKLEEATPNSEK
jgi:DNA-binding NtrC family response regulator